MNLSDLSPEHAAAVRWLTEQSNLVRGLDENGALVPEITEQQMLDGLVAQFPDIRARLEFAVKQMHV